ncbi:MAG: prenyltransferase/squalene oxidase repeat-containing protein [Planctomycetia bacterium]
MPPDDQTNPEPPFPAPPSGARSSAVVGGFPWSYEPAAAPLPQFDVRPSTVTQTPIQRRPPEPLLWPVVRERIRSIIDKSPAWTLSLSLHLVLLIALALFSVRQIEPKRPTLTLTFAPEAGKTGEPDAADVAETPDVVEIVKPNDAEVAVAAQPVVNPEPVVEPAPAPPSPEPVVAVEAGGAAAAQRIVIGTALSGRAPAARQKLLGDGGGTVATEAAVALALDWIVRQQKKDGLWSLKGPYGDGGSQENRLAATAMALIALQGAGNSTREGDHRAIVAKAWKALVKGQKPDGTFETGGMLEQHAMYAHAQATIALCEAYGMTKDPFLEEPARRALGYAIAAQMPDGGWRYHPPQPEQDSRGDMSVTGWYLMALKSGEMAGLPVPAAAYEKLSGFLDAVFVSDEKGYGYQINPNQKFFDFRPALTAEGLLCRQYLGWRRDEPRLVAGVELLLREAPIDFDYRKKNVYAWYYATQVCHHLGGAAWTRWNRRMQEQLLGEQVQTGREKGSWDPANDQWGHVGGRLYMTALCGCMLEVYYRHLPLYSERDR